MLSSSFLLEREREGTSGYISRGETDVKVKEEEERKKFLRRGRYRWHDVVILLEKEKEQKCMR